MPTGTLRSGGNKMDKTSAISIDYRATAPVIYTATDGTDDVELVTRSVIIQMDEKQKLEGTRREDFQCLQVNGWQPLFRLARLLINGALDVSLDEARDLLKANLHRTPLQMDGRLRKNLAVVLLGLQFLPATLTKHGFPQDLISLVAGIEQETLTSSQGQAVEAMRKVHLTEVDQTYQTLSEMAEATSDRGNHYLVAGTYYVLQDNKLYVRRNR
jgi:hypothetical protein